MKRIHAFGLVELIVVVVIMGIIASTAIPIVQKATIRSRVAAQLLPVLEGYRLRLESIFGEPEVPAIGALCFIDRLPTYTPPSGSTVSGVRLRFGGNYHRIQVHARMGAVSSGGIGLEQIGSNPLILELQVINNAGVVPNVQCLYNTDYEEYVPIACKDGAMSTSGWGGLGSNSGCSTTYISIPEIQDSILVDWASWNCGCNTSNFVHDIKFGSQTWSDTTFRAMVKCDPCWGSAAFWWPSNFTYNSATNRWDSVWHNRWYEGDLFNDNWLN